MKLSEEVKQFIKGTEFMPIATSGDAGAHLVSTWGGENKDGYVFIIDDETIAWPAGTYRKTEENVRKTEKVQTLVALREKHNGYRLEGTAKFIVNGPIHRMIKERFPWARAAVVMKIERYEKLL